MNQDRNTQTKLSEYILNDQLILAGFSTAIILIVTQLILVGLYVWQLPPEIPLFHSLLAGADQLVDRVWLVIIPILSIISLFITWILIKISLQFITTFHQIISWFSVLIVFLGTISVVHVIVLVY